MIPVSTLEASMSHLPVMAGEVMRLIDAAPGRHLVDLTVGGGGHARAFLEAATPAGRLTACDRDPVALDCAREVLAGFGDQVRYLAGDWVSCLQRLAADGVAPDAVLMDLGVSSMQLDDSVRGFSLRVDGPLDMRMDPTRGPRASEFLNSAGLEEITHALEVWGGEPKGGRIASAIVTRRRRRPFRTTGDLRRLVEEVLGRRGGRIHPATRTFQGIRMAVNDEEAQLKEGLVLAVDLLAPGGCLAVISFHSGDDRLVKTQFRALAGVRGTIVTRRPVVPGREEQRANRRSRSAKLRVFRRTEGGSA